MDIKKIILQKKIDGVVYQVYPQTSADQVVYGETTVSAQLAQIATDISNITTATTGTIDTRVKAATDALYEKIMGVTDASDINEAYDTLKEVAEYLDAHGSVVSGFTSDIAALKTALGAPAHEEDGQPVAASGLFATVADNAANIEALQTTVGDANSGLVKDVADLKAASTNVADSDTNGNIVVDGSEITVYDDSELAGRVTTAEDDIDTLEGVVGNESSGLVKDVADNASAISTLEGTVGDENNGLVKDVADNASAISTLEGTVGDSTSGLVKDVADNAAAISSLQSGSATITYGTADKETLADNELYMKIIG